MSMKSLLSVLAAGAAFVLLGAATAPTAQAGSVGVNVQLNGYIPAPPGVHIYYESGRPYYVENHQRVYLKQKEKEHHDHGKKKGHKKHHRD
ncbi:hypothetical protein [Geomonas diazotrophica]|uniref:hypothetical protein n=1 Tax=Geomonas diazotrophica TaxID=2843197 RepID=UPI001EF28EFD|nr:MULTISPECIES: hypothetical protein [Geomonas]